MVKSGATYISSKEKTCIIILVLTESLEYLQIVHTMSIFVYHLGVKR